MSRKIKRTYTLVSVIIVLLLLSPASVIHTSSMPDSLNEYRYIRLQADTDGMGFEYTDTFSYRNVEPMSWDSDEGLTDIDGLGYLAEQWIDTETKSIINIYYDHKSNNWYSLCFDENPVREGRIYAAHITCGA